jgi:hypothetical protein
VKAVKPSTRNPSIQTEPFLSSFDYSSIEQSLTFHGISPQLCKLFFLTSSYRNPIQSTIASSKPQVQLIATLSSFVHSPPLPFTASYNDVNDFLAHHRQT